jgi:hypothetical protein
MCKHSRRDAGSTAANMPTCADTTARKVRK